MFIPMFNNIKKRFSFDIAGVMGDSAFDSESILNYIFKELKAKPYIARNPRRKTNLEYKVSSKGFRICIAGFEMLYWGRFKIVVNCVLNLSAPLLILRLFERTTQLVLCGTLDSSTAKVALPIYGQMKISENALIMALKILKRSTIFALVPKESSAAFYQYVCNGRLSKG